MFLNSRLLDDCTPPKTSSSFHEDEHNENLIHDDELILLSINPSFCYDPFGLPIAEIDNFTKLWPLFVKDFQTILDDHNNANHVGYFNRRAQLQFPPNVEFLEEYLTFPHRHLEELWIVYEKNMCKFFK